MVRTGLYRGLLLPGVVTALRRQDSTVTVTAERRHTPLLPGYTVLSTESAMRVRKSR